MARPPRPPTPEDPASRQLRDTWLAIGTPTLTVALVAGAFAASLAEHRVETVIWVALALVAAMTGRSRRSAVQRVGWLATAVAGFVLAVLTASLPAAVTVLFVGAAWLVMGSLVLVPPRARGTSSLVVVLLVVGTPLLRDRLQWLPDLGGPGELATTALGLAVTLGGLHALGLATIRAFAAHRERTSRLHSAIATLEQELEEAHARILLTQDDTDRLLASVSHELRTPLSAVRGYTEIVLEDLENSELASMQEDLSRIHVATSQLLDRIGSMLELAPTDPLRHDLQVEPVDIAGVVSDAVGIVARRLEGNGNRLQLDGPADPPPFCTDLVRLRHLVVELLSHAAALTRNGFVVVRWQVRSHRLEFAVEASREGGARTRELGLAGPRRLVGSLEGTLRVTAAAGAGTTVLVQLPDLDRQVPVAPS